MGMGEDEATETGWKPDCRFDRRFRGNRRGGCRLAEASGGENIIGLHY